MSAIEIYTDLKKVIEGKDNKEVFTAMRFLSQEVENEYYRAQDTERSKYYPPAVCPDNSLPA